MALVYFDASALVKLVVDEEGSDLADRLWNDGDAILSSRLSYPEVCAALAAARRNRQLTAAQLHRASAQWEELWRGVRPVELRPDLAVRAGELAGRHALKASDAVHVASALAIGDPALVVAVWDRRLHAAVRAEGFAVAPATLDPSA